MSTWPGLAGLARRRAQRRSYTAQATQAKHLHCTKQTYWARWHRGRLPPFCCSSKHKQVSQSFQGLACCLFSSGCVSERTTFAHTRTLKLLERTRIDVLHSWERTRIKIIFQFCGSWFLRILHKFRWFYGAGAAGCKNLVDCSLFLLFTSSSFFFLSHDIASTHSTFFKITLQSSSFLLIVVHDCISAFVWPNTGRHRMWAVVLEVQQPLKVSRGLNPCLHRGVWTHVYIKRFPTTPQVSC